MKQTIQYLYKPEQPVAPTFIQGVVQDADLETLLTAADRTSLELEWASLAQTHPGIFSKPKGLGSLYDTFSLPVLLYHSTDFKTYVSTSRYADRGTPLGNGIQNAMRISAVGCAVTLADGSVLVHRRPHHATHVADKYDVGVAGLAHIQVDGTFDFPKTVRDKFARELNIGEKHLISLQLTGVHSSSAPDFSGMVDFNAQIIFDFDELKERANPTYLQDMLVISPQNLPDYLTRSFIHGEDLIADGAAGLLASLPHHLFVDTVAKMNATEQRVFFGELRNGIFIEKPFP